MRKIIVSNLITLDGYFEGMNQDLSWFKVDEEFFDYARQQLLDVDTILFGRITYEYMAAYWPDAKDNNAVITEKMNNHKKIVFSNTIDNPQWSNTTVIHTHTIDMKSRLEEKVKELKNEPGGDMVIFGSGTLVAELTQARLIDEFRLIMNPVILGNGNPLFKSLNEKLELKLTGSKVLSNGTVILYYHPEQ